MENEPLIVDITIDNGDFLIAMLNYHRVLHNCRPLQVGFKRKDNGCQAFNCQFLTSCSFKILISKWKRFPPAPRSSLHHQAKQHALGVSGVHPQVSAPTRRSWWCRRRRDPQKCQDLRIRNLGSNDQNGDLTFQFEFQVTSSVSVNSQLIHL